MTGQAAMEYLMTYGWALLVIVIVISILLFLNPFATPAGCRFDQLGFTCTTPVIQANGALFMKLTNGNSNNVVIQSVVCVLDKTNTRPTFTTGGWVPVGGQQFPRETTLETTTTGVGAHAVTCQSSTGTTLNMPVGSDFSGRVWVAYRNEEDPGNYPVRVASATITTKTVQ